MATVINLGDLLELRVWSQELTQASVQKYHFLVGSMGGGPVTDVNVVTQFDAGMNGPMKAILNNNATYRGCQAQIINRSPMAAAVFTTLNQGAGLAGSTSLPRQTAGIISTATNLAGRRFRGRTYLPFPATIDDTGDGAPTSSYLTRLNAIASFFIIVSVFNGATMADFIGGSWVINHRAGKTPTPPPTVITSFVPQQLWATQRRRGSFGRENSSPI